MDTRRSRRCDSSATKATAEAVGLVPPRDHARKSFGLVEVDRWQVSHLVLGEIEPDAVRDACHGTDRNGDPLLAPEVALVEQDVCHVMDRWDR